MHGLLAPLASWIVSVIAAAGYAGIAGLMALESMGVPLPSEVIMPFAGYLASTGRLDLYLVAIAGAIGCNLGSIPAYAIGRYGGRPLILRFGRFLLIGPGELDRAERFFARAGSLAVLVGRLLPVVRSIIAYPAGIARMGQVRFHLYTFVGSWPWCFALALIGKHLGRAWDSDPRLRAVLHKADLAVVAAVVLLAAAYAWHRVRSVRRG